MVWLITCLVFLLQLNKTKGTSFPKNSGGSWETNKKKNDEIQSRRGRAIMTFKKASLCSSRRACWMVKRCLNGPPSHLLDVWIGDCARQLGAHLAQLLSTDCSPAGLESYQPEHGNLYVSSSRNITHTASCHHKAPLSLQEAQSQHSGEQHRVHDQTFSH